MDTANPLCAELTLLEPADLRLYLDDFEDLVLEIDTEAKRIVVRDTSLFEAPDKKTKK